MTPRRIIVLAVALSLAGAGAAHAAFPAAKSHAIVIGKSIGGVALGDSLAKAQATWGPGAACTIKGGKGACEYLGTASSPTIHPAWAAFGVTNGKVTAVFIYPPFNKATNSYLLSGPSTKFATSNGIHIGSTKKALRRAYPHARSVAKGAQFRITKGRVRTLFSLIKGRVYSVAVTQLAKKA